jgi:hypothetical protein
MRFPKLSLKRWKLTALATVGGVAVVAGGVWAVSFVVSAIFNYNPSGGSISAYNMVYFDTTSTDCLTIACDSNHHGAGTVRDTGAFLYLTNPTPIALRTYVRYFNSNGNPTNPTQCEPNTYTIYPNQVQRIDLRGWNVGYQHGVIKIATFDDNASGFKVQAGLKGWLATFREIKLAFSGYTGDVAMRETPLAEVPVPVLVRPQSGKAPYELEQIVNNNCP